MHPIIGKTADMHARPRTPGARTTNHEDHDMTKTIITGALAALLAFGATGASAEPRAFATPEEAVGEVINTLEARDRDGLIAIFGPENEDVILSGDAQRDIDDWGSFLAAYRQMSRIAVQDDGSATLYVGTDQWPLPIRLVKGEGEKWRFDSDAGQEQMHDQRIGRNELDVIELMKGYVKVQARFRQADYDGDGVMEFARSIISDADKRDGLYWPSAEGAPESPVGDFVARATAVGYSFDGKDQEPEPYLGYYYHLLTKQGATAPGGALDYMVSGNMLAGHALIAFPADYGESGIMSFLVGENGVVLEKNLGEDTLAAAAAIEAYDPGDGWEPAKDEE